jgi:thiol-disulfide isomerase/thioredoxin
MDEPMTINCQKWFSLFASIILLMFSASVLAATLEVEDVYGKKHQFTNTKGKWIIINYWATWCGACVEEIPQLNKLSLALKDKPVIFFGINYDHQPSEDQKAFADHYRVGYLLLPSNPFKTLVATDQITSLPVTYVISPQGQVQELNGELRPEEILKIIS